MAEEDLNTLIHLAEFTARTKSEKEILHLLTIRGGKPRPEWDEDDLLAAAEVRKAFELALQLKKNKA